MVKYFCILYFFKTMDEQLWLRGKMLQTHFSQLTVGLEFQEVNCGLNHFRPLGEA